jgi:hypothetical protein
MVSRWNFDWMSLPGVSINPRKFDKQLHGSHLLRIKLFLPTQTVVSDMALWIQATALHPIIIVWTQADQFIWNKLSPTIHLIRLV